MSAPAPQPTNASNRVKLRPAAARRIGRLLVRWTMDAPRFLVVNDRIDRKVGTRALNRKSNLVRPQPASCVNESGGGIKGPSESDGLGGLVSFPVVNGRRFPGVLAWLTMSRYRQKTLKYKAFRQSIYNIDNIIS